MIFLQSIEKQLPSTRTAELGSISLKAEVIPVLSVERLEGGLGVLEETLHTA